MFNCTELVKDQRWTITNGVWFEDLVLSLRGGKVFKYKSTIGGWEIIYSHWEIINIYEIYTKILLLILIYMTKY